MARKVATMVHVSGRLTALTAVHVGGEGATLSQDMPLARDGRDRLFIPGTSLAGPMRSWWEARFGERSAREIFGYTARDAGKARKAGEPEGASRITVLDVPLDARDADVETRDHVTIDAATGAAADKGKYDREVVPAGASGTVRLRFEIGSGRASPDGATDAEVQLDRFAALVNALTRGEIQIGGAKTRGLGRVRLQVDRAESFSPTAHGGMLALLRARTDPAKRGDSFDWETRAARADGSGRRIVRLSVRWTSELPVFSLGPSPASAADMAPLISGQGDGSLMLPGSSIKGVLRAQAARIANTVAGEAGRDLVAALFGAPGKPKQKKNDGEDAGPTKDRGPRPGLGAVSVADCPIGPTIARRDWSALDAGGDESDRVSRATAALDAATTLKGWRFADHVAIDRWTGGASDGALYTVLEPGSGQSGSFEISLDLDRLGFDEIGPDDRRRAGNAAVVLFLLTLRDLVLGRVTFGFGANRGNGSLTIDTITLSGAGFIGLGEAPELGLEGLRDWSLFADLKFAADWTEWCKSPRKEAAA